MSIPLDTRKSMAERDDIFRARIASRVLDVALDAYDNPPVTGVSVTSPPTTKQDKREKLASLVIQDVMSYVTPFAWWMVSISSYTVPEDITDPQIINNIQVTGAFDQIADQILIF